MQYALMLYFDEKTTKMVSGLLNKLKNVTNNSYMLGENMPAHITLAMWNSDYDYLDVLKSFAQESQSFDINFSSIGFFNDDEQHIFFAPIKNTELMMLHKRVYEAIPLEDERDFIQIYKDDDEWMPHVTIGYQVKDGMMEQALSMCLDIPLPVKARAVKLAYAVCCPFKEIEVFELK